MNVWEEYQKDGYQAQRVASTEGGEYHGPCPRCGGKDRFIIQPEQGENGRYFCRQCRIAGDLIQYCRDVKGMTFPEACRFVGWDLPDRPGYRTGKKFPASTTHSSTPQEQPNETSVVDPVLWQGKARALVAEGVYNLWHYQQDRWLRWLTEHRGLNEETIKAASLGVMLLDRWSEPHPWGLSPELKEDGRVKKLWFLQGHLIPLLGEGGEVLRVKFRRPKSAGDPRYLFLRGSSNAVRVINPQSSIFVVLENELDGLLLAQEGSSLGIGVIALGSASIKPDSLSPEIQTALKNSSCILVGLDYDKPKATKNDKDAWAGGRATKTWLREFPQAVRCIPVKGKDVGEMWQGRVSLKTWIEKGIERATGQLIKKGD